MGIPKQGLKEEFSSRVGNEFLGSCLLIWIFLRATGKMDEEAEEISGEYTLILSYVKCKVALFCYLN